MKIYKEESLSNFEFWSGAKEFASKLTESEFDTIEATLEDMYPDGMDETQINDLFWFEYEWICSDILGVDYDEIMERE